MNEDPSANDASAPDAAVPDPPGAPLRGLMLALAVAALAVTAFLTISALGTGVQPPGCGADSGCAQVLNSSWSRVLGVPVSALAALLYMVLLPGLVMTGSASASRRRLAWTVLLIGAGAILAAAGWFLAVQVLVLEAWCAWCLTSHGLGAALAGLILWQGHQQRARDGVAGIAPQRALASALAGVAMVGLMAGAQAMTSEPAGRELPVAGIPLDPANEPRIGSADAEHVVAVLVDYACGSCRMAHRQLMQARQELDLAVVVLPTALNPQCNRHVARIPGPQFRDNCNIALLAVAVHEADPQQFEAFDEWVFDQGGPVAAQRAFDKAAELVGEQTLREVLDGGRAHERLERNAEIYGRSGTDRVPVIFMPEFAMSGGIDQANIRRGLGLIED